MIWDFVSTFAMSVSFSRVRDSRNHPQIRSQTLKTKIRGRNKKQQKTRKKTGRAFFLRPDSESRYGRMQDA
jgi:hypothetical protein